MATSPNRTSEESGRFRFSEIGVRTECVSGIGHLCLISIQELDGGIGKLLRLAYSGKKAQRVSLPFDGSFGMAGGDPRVDGVRTR
jgi:hypothetical protein